MTSIEHHLEDNHLCRYAPALRYYESPQPHESPQPPVLHDSIARLRAFSMLLCMDTDLADELVEVTLLRSSVGRGPRRIRPQSLDLADQEATQLLLPRICAPACRNAGAKDERRSSRYPYRPCKASGRAARSPYTGRRHPHLARRGGPDLPTAAGQVQGPCSRARGPILPATSRGRARRGRIRTTSRSISS
jgi:hypothetical protein